MTGDPRADEHRRDAELIARAATGDTEAFRQLYDGKHRQVYRVAYQILGDAGMAEDVVQESFVALWKHCGRYRRRFAVNTWLNRIATNRAIDRWRAERRHVKAGVSDGATEEPAVEGARSATAAAGMPHADPSSRARWREVQAIWDRLAADLTPQQRAAFTLREIEGLPAADVAAALDCSVSTVRSHIALARRTLREALRRDYPELAEEEAPTGAD